jgi:hypothetical protein
VFAGLGRLLTLWVRGTFYVGPVAQRFGGRIFLYTPCRYNTIEVREHQRGCVLQSTFINPSRTYGLKISIPLNSRSQSSAALTTALDCKIRS